MATSTGPPLEKQARFGLALCVAAGMLITTSSTAQTSSNTCGTLAANKYPVNSTCVPQAFNTVTGYTAVYNPGGCNATARKDAFGWFQATTTLTTVRYTPTGGADAILHVLAACGGAVLGCSDVGVGNGAETVTIPTIPGNNYYVRVQRYNSNTNMTGNLCIFNPTCLFRLTLNDSYGDGWADIFGQAYVEIIVNGVSLGLWSLNAGFTGYVDFGVTDGDIVQVIYSDGGALFYDENSMDLSVNGQCLFQSYTPPNIGLAYSVTADCTPSTTALAQDCVGGATICGNASITNNSVSTGCVLDLDASNQGCLTSFERQGSWYFFSPSSSGTVGFTITPSGNIDYDFAIWGPFSSVQCPTGPPVRCSWADGLFTPTYLTGMGNGAMDVSEDQNGDGWVQTLNVMADSVYVLYVDNFSSTGQAFILDWELTNGASLDCTTLPVELIDLQANARSPVIDVIWTTATEHNSHHFTVERSPDNVTFTSIGTVAAAGNAQFRNDYLFVDETPFRGVNYYRLEQVDMDGASVRSQTVVATLTNSEDRPTLYPNPVSDVLNVVFPPAMGKPVKLVILDALGRAVAAVSTDDLSGQRTAQLPIGQLAPGWYNLRIDLADGSVVTGGGFLKK